MPEDLVYYWRAGNGVQQAQGQWLGPARVIEIEGGNVWVSHHATAIKCAKEQLRMASPAEREMRKMLMRIGGDDPDERFKHGVPRQQDLTHQQFHPEPGPQVKQDTPRQEPVHERQETRPNQEPQHTPRQKQRVRMQDDSPTVDDGWESDFVLWKQVRQRWRLIKCQSLSCPLFQKMMI